MEDIYTTLKKVVNEAEVTILNDTVKVLFPEHLLFSINSTELNPPTYPLMERFAGALNKYNRTSILINGYTDNTGSKEYNAKISKERALATRKLLQENQVDSLRMHTWGLGVDNPIAPNSTEEGRRKNRRVEFIILYSYEKPQ